MALVRRIVVAATAGALLATPLAATADAAVPFSVTVLHCGGGIHITAYDTLPKATRVLHKLVKVQLRVPHSLHKIQLRQGDHILVKSNRPC